jgi:hypothetical protein
VTAAVSEPVATGDGPVRIRLTPLVLLVAGLMFAVMMILAARYGYDRDEMYFIVAGGHPAFGYPDQPPLVPLLSWLMNKIGPGSLYLLRLPSALAAAATVVVTGATARDAGGGRGAQVIAAAVAAVSAISLATGHFVTTTTFDVLATALLGWLIVRAVLLDDLRALLWAGLVIGIAGEAKPQIVIVAIVTIVAVAVVGPRHLLRSHYLWIGAAIAAALVAPYLIWQAQHGWPQETVARNIAGTAESGRAGFIPFQLVMVSPLMVPVWVAGLVSAWRTTGRRTLRAIPLTYLLLAGLYLLGNGKAYYLASLYPTLIALGSIPTARWLDRGRQRLRRATLAVAIGISALTSAVVALPVLPASALPGSASIQLNPDLGETVGWSQFINAVDTAWQSVPAATRAHAVIFTENYGEAGAIDVLGGHDRLPQAFSGHNGFSLWAMPRPDQTTTIVVGYDSPASVAADFTGCRVVDRVTNPYKLNNDEYGLPVMRCSGLTAPWTVLWPRLRHYD